MTLPIILSLSPFVLFIFLLLVRKTPLIWVTTITLILVEVLAVFFWRVSPEYIFGSIFKGFLVAFDILLIIFGAIFFLEIATETKIIQNIGFYLETISRDIRVQVIFLAWFFECFLEGTAGFGTPSTVVAPILIGLGISPINAVIISLLGNSTSVAFGAAGTPIKVGLNSIYGPNVPYLTSVFNFAGVLVPIFMIWFITKNKSNGKREFLEALPFALWSGIAFVIPSILTVFLGQEFPSILGSVIGMILVLITTKLGIFVPKFERNLTDNPKPMTLSLSKVVFPYLLLIALLVIGKFTLGSVGFKIPIIIKHTLLLFNPGLGFVITGLVVGALYKLKSNFLATSAKIAIGKSVEPFLVIAFMSVISQIMVVSSHNFSTLPSMVELLAVFVKNSLLPFWTPFVGAFGSFLTGSATVSNLMFGSSISLAAQGIGMNVDRILAVLVVGGAAGNMIALGDIITAETVVGLKNREKSVLSGVIVPCLVYLILTGLIGVWVS